MPAIEGLFMFQTLKYCEELEKAKFSAAQAKATVQVVTDAVSHAAASKTDLTLAQQKIEHEIKSLESRLVIKLGAMLTVALALLATYLKMKT